MPLSVGRRNVTGGYMGARPMIRAYAGTGDDNAKIVFGTEAVLGVPQNVEVDIRNNVVSLTWDPVIGATNYRVQWRGFSPGYTWADAERDGVILGDYLVSNGRDITHDTFTLSTIGSYDLRIQAIGKRNRTSGWGLPIAPFSITSLTPPPSLERPTSAPVVTYTVGENSVVFNISTPPRATRLQYTIDGVIWNTTERRLSVFGLASSTTYTYRFRGVNSSGQGPATTITFTTGQVAGAPTAAPSLSLTASTNSIVAEIGTINNADRYSIQWRRSGDVWNNWRLVSSPHTISGLTAGTLYNVQARAENSSGAGPNRSVNITTPSVAVRPVAPIVTTTNTSNSITFTLTSAGVRFFEYLRPNGSWTRMNQFVNTLTLSGLSSGSSVRVSFRASNNIGTSEATGFVTYHTLPSTPEATFTKTGTTIRGIIGEVNGGVSYQYWFNGIWTTIPSGATRFRIYNLTKGTRYSIRVRVSGQGGTTEARSYIIRTLGASVDRSKSISTSALRAANRNINIFGMTTDGSTLWVLDNTSQEAYAFSKSTLARLSSKDITASTINRLPATNPELAGMSVDDLRIWIADKRNARVWALDKNNLAYNPDGGFSRVLLANVSPRGRFNIEAITTDGITMWISDTTSDAIYAFNVATKARDSAKDITSITLNEISDQMYVQGMCTDGTTLWAANNTSGNIHAFALSNGLRTPDLDISRSLILSATGDDDVYIDGLATDGDTLWVGDNTSTSVIGFSIK